MLKMIYELKKKTLQNVLDRNRERAERAHGAVVGKGKQVRRSLPQKPENSIQVTCPHATITDRVRSVYV